MQVVSMISCMVYVKRELNITLEQLKLGKKLALRYQRVQNPSKGITFNLSLCNFVERTYGSIIFQLDMGVSI